MKQQVFVIHGGTAFATYEEYISYLRAKEVSLEKLQAQDWKMELQGVLGDEFDVFLPKMPNSQNATYLEWCIWFEKFLPLLNDGVIFVGHSLGAVFLAKYLSEHTIKRKISATLLVAPPYGTDLGLHLPQFSITSTLLGLQEQGGTVIMYHSKDDPVVAFSELSYYIKAFPTVEAKIFEDRGHFNMRKFPEIIDDIKNFVI